MPKLSTPLGFFPVDVEIPRYYSMQGEDMNYARKYWINRKADRFTFSTSFMRSGWTKSNKQWFKWEQAYAVSVSARRTKTGKQTVSLYLNNRMGYRSALKNLTTNPAMVNVVVGDEVIPEILKELELLAVRQGFITQAELNKVNKNVTDNINLRFYSLLTLMAYPLAKTIYSTDSNRIYDVSYDEGIPAFAGKHLRLPNLETLASTLKLGKEAKVLFLQNASKLPLQNLYFFELTAGFAADETQVKILKDMLDKGEKSHFVDNRWQLESRKAYTPYMRQVLRKVPAVSLQNVLTSRFFFDDMSHALHTWMGLSKYEKNFNFTTPVHELREAVVDMQELIMRRKQTQTVSDSEFLSLIDSINDNKHVQYNSNAYIEVRFGAYSAILNSGRQHNDSRTRRISNVNSAQMLNLSHPLWQKYRKSEHFVKNDIELAGYSHSREVQADPMGSGGSFSPKLYLEFLQEILKEAEARLIKHGIPLTTESRGFSFALVTIEMMRSSHRMFKQTPRKVYKLYKAGVDSDLIFQSMLYKVPVKEMEQYAGMPASWVQNIYSWSPVRNSDYDF